MDIIGIDSRIEFSTHTHTHNLSRQVEYIHSFQRKKFQFGWRKANHIDDNIGRKDYKIDQRQR